MSKKILVVQSRENPVRIRREQENFRNVIGELAETVFISSLDERLSWTTPDEFLAEYDGVIFGGSSDFDFDGGRLENDPARLISMMILSRTKNLVAYALAEKFPLLGVCYGHQIIANIYGGEVNHDKEQSKFGSFEVCLTEEGKQDALFSNVPQNFIAQYAHNDSVTRLPKGATLLASADGCRFSALRYGESAYTVQFHPELTRFDDYDLDYKDSPEASKVVPLWLERVVKQA